MTPAPRPPAVTPRFPAAAVADPLADYAARYADLFPRADQSRRFLAYLRGLLAAGGRKNVEAIALTVRADEPGTDNLTQALNHFIARSPWDADRVVARYRELVRPAVGDRGGLVVHDGVIPKKGRHSVGTQRQLARDLGRKVNCQVAVVVGHVGPSGYLPLAVRLYLPGQWLRDAGATVERTVPPAFRTPTAKPAVALALLDELAADGWPVAAVAAEPGYAGSAAFADGLADRRAALDDAAEPVAQAVAGFGRLKVELGLEHFEGRTWVGWHHHAALVLAAHGYRVTTDLTE